MRGLSKCMAITLSAERGGGSATILPRMLGRSGGLGDAGGGILLDRPPRLFDKSAEFLLAGVAGIDVDLASIQANERGVAVTPEQINFLVRPLVRRLPPALLGGPQDAGEEHIGHVRGHVEDETG